MKHTADLLSLQSIAACHTCHGRLATLYTSLEMQTGPSIDMLVAKACLTACLQIED